jgi:uncharacterized membrane protein
MARMLPDKEPAVKVAGPYGHPIHPILVTVPIGAWVASLVFDLVSRSSDLAAYTIAAKWLIGIGVIGAAVAAVFGLMDLLTIPNRTPARRVGYTHLALNTLVLLAFAVSWLQRDDVAQETSTGLIVLSVIALAVLTVSGWLGGRMTYRYGVRVAREQDQSEGYEIGEVRRPRAA